MSVGRSRGAAREADAKLGEHGIRDAGRLEDGGRPPVLPVDGSAARERDGQDDRAGAHSVRRLACLGRGEGRVPV